MREVDPYDTHWSKVVALVQGAFRNVTLVEKFTWQTVVLI